MSLDIQIRNDTLLSIVRNTAQSRLNDTCFPPLETLFIDHVDVTGAAMAVAQQAINFSVFVNAFIVDRSSVIAHTDQTPPEALSPFGQATILLQLSLRGASLSIRCTDIQAEPRFDSMRERIRDTIGTVADADISSLFTQFKLAAPSTSSLHQIDNTVLMRFGDNPNRPVSRLSPDQEWCLFINGPTMEAITQAQLEDGPLRQLARNNVTVSEVDKHWAPVGSIAHVNVTIAGDAKVPDPASGRLFINLEIDFRLVPFVGASVEVYDLVNLVNWNVRSDLGPFGHLFESLVEDMIAQSFDPASFGGTPVGPNTFVLRQALPSISLGHAEFHTNYLVGLPEGMVIAGPVNQTPSSTAILTSLPAIRFPGHYSSTSYCAGMVPHRTTPEITATVTLNNFGDRLCSVEAISPTTVPIAIEPYLSYSWGPGPHPTTVSLSLTMSIYVALSITDTGEPLVLLIRSPRGVRAIDLGIPPRPPAPDESDISERLRDLHLENCDTIETAWSRFIHRQIPPFWLPDPPPFGWVDKLHEVARFESSVLTIANVKAGEAVTLKHISDGAVSTFTQDVAGDMLIPTVIAFRTTNEGAILEKSIRADFGDVKTASKVFNRVAILKTPNAISHELRADGQEALILTTYQDRVETAEVDAFGAVKLNRETHLVEKTMTDTATQSRPLPLTAGKYAATNTNGWPSCVLAGHVATHPLPGFEQDPIAVAELDDGTYRVIVRDGSRVKVTGSLPSWPRIPPVVGSWALSASTGDELAVFSVAEIIPVQPGACCCRMDAGGKAGGKTGTGNVRSADRLKRANR